MKQRLRKNKGITIVSLVVTIIVLIILAGITISVLFGEQGLIKRSKEVKPMQDVATAKEELELLKAPVQIDNNRVDLDGYLAELNEVKTQYKASNIERLNETNAEVLINSKYKFLLKDTEMGDVEIIYQGEAGGLVISPTRGTYRYPTSGTFEVIENESGGELSVSSSNDNIAKASIEGTTVTVMPGTVAGEATITVTSAANGKFAEGKVTYIAEVTNGEIIIEATPYNGIYDGNEHAALTNVKITPSDAKVEYSLNGGEFTEIMPKVSGANEYTISIKASKEGYTTATDSWTVTVGQKEAGNFTVTLSENEYTYDGTAKTPAVTVKDGTKTLTSGTDYTVAYSNNTNAGTATVTVTGKGNYTGTKTANFTINRAPITISATPYSGTYDGSAHAALTNVKITPSDATVKYYLDGVDKGTTIPTVTGAKTYTVSISVSKENYETATDSWTVTVGQKGAANFTVTLGQTTYTYDGTAKTPAVTVKDGTKTLTSGTDYTVAYSNNTNAGTATVTVTGKGNYTGTKTANFTINKATITIEATAYSGTYDGSAHAALTNVKITPSDATVKYYLDGVNKGTTIPTVTGASTYSVAITASKDNYETVTETITVTVAKANGSGSVTMAGWVAGNTAANPVPSSSTNGTSAVTYQYKVSTAADTTYTATKPTTAGIYTVKATFAATTNYNECTATTNFTITTAIAQIGSVYYSSLQNAITAAPNNTATTVTMLANTNESNITISATKNINLNVNSKTITGNMTNSGTLSLSSGTIVGNGNYTINNAGTITITSMNITNSNRVIHNTGTVSFKSGTLKCTNGGAHTVVSSKNFTMTGGSILITGSGGGAAFISTGTTNITGGTITASEFGLVARGGITTVTNSTIKATGTRHSLMVDNTGTARVTSSTITNTGGGYAVYSARGYDYCNIYSRASNYGISGSVAGKVKATTNISTGQAQEKVTIYNSGYASLEWGTWTVNNGQDDLLWEQTSASSGTTHTYIVKKSVHGNETGNYNTHVYVANSSTYIAGFGLKF